LNNLFENSENKEVFIFDEADNSLDKKNQQEFRQRVKKLAQKKVVILVSHTKF
jgi:ABC-type bacteriocin/lantibiotic exporter with double-glycine peptidase domain